MLFCVITPLPINVFALIIPDANLAEEIVEFKILASVTAPVPIVLVTTLPLAIAC